MTDSAITRSGAVPRVPDRGQAVAYALRRPRYEVLPLAGTADQIEAHVPRDLPITVTASPRHGLDATLALTEALTQRSFRVVPHLAARLVRDDAHLAEILHRLDAAGVQDVFLVTGDSERPIGSFSDSLALLTALQRLRQSGVGRRLEQVGITGYPQGHPQLSAAEVTEALRAKVPLSTYVVSQLCFDASAVSTWVARVRQAGVALPVYVGVPGAVDQLKLLRIAQRIGVHASARFTRKQRGLSRLLRPGGYRPDALLRGLADDLGDPSRGVCGLHIYTFGDVAATERWRQRTLERLSPTRHG